jgi:hypothetical protein
MTDRADDREVLDSGNWSKVFADDLSAVIPAGAVTHLVFSTLQPEPYSGKLDRIVALHLTIPTDQVARITGLLAKGRLPLPTRVGQQAEEEERITLQ